MSGTCSNYWRNGDKWDSSYPQEIHSLAEKDTFRVYDIRMDMMERRGGWCNAGSRDTGASLPGFEHQWPGWPWPSDLISLSIKELMKIIVSTLWLDMWLVIITPRPVPGTQWTPYQCLLNGPSVSLPFLKSSFAPFCTIAYTISSLLMVLLLAEMSHSHQAPCKCSHLHCVLLYLPPPSPWFGWHFSVCSGSICLIWLYWGHLSLIISPVFSCFVYVSLLLWT